MFDWEAFSNSIFSPFFLQAAWTTLWLSVVAQLAGVILGLFLALMRMSRFKWLSFPVQAYVWFFRGSPLLVQVLLLWDGLPKLVPGLLFSQIACILIAFSLNEAAYMSEIIRAGISSVDPGQMEAARALGMRYWLAMRRIILPQAARVIIPPLGNEFNNMLKTTSIASVIGLEELTGTAEILGAPSFSIFELLIVATLYYLLLTTLWDYFQRWIERRLDPEHAARGRPPRRRLRQKSWTQRVLGFGNPPLESGELIAGGHGEAR
ncbi:amino acid ABC transporter permease [Thermogemmatispora sp.]|uniref:amino acid ABC transporter permease n=1 Tax=Thermogemmatispora sp. TaxID=1968838 RepID=UPI0035E446A9